MKATTNHDDYMRERLVDDRFAAEYLQAALDDGQSDVLLLALRRIAEARGGMTKLARQTGLAREALYRTLGKGGNPRLATLTAILAATGLRFTVAPLVPAAKRLATKRQKVARPARPRVGGRESKMRAAA